MHFTVSRAAAVAGLIMLAATAAFAQFRAGIQGSVIDPSGATVPNAKITLINNETQGEQTTQSTAEGFYRFSNLAPGSYTLRAEAQGFKMFEAREIPVRAERVEGVDVTLQTGAITESVTVSGDSLPLLQTEQANVQGTLTREQIERLPQLNRDPYELLRLTPGVFGVGARGNQGGALSLPNSTGPGGSNTSIFQTENQVPISANGQRVSANNYMVDGVSVNSLNWGGAAVVTPNQESVKQISVKANAYSAEYGRNSGAQIEVVSQNGGNEFHGSALFKLNSPGLNAYNKYGGLNNAAPIRVENRFRQWAGSLGGPVVRDKLFFFFSYEGLRNRSNTPYTNWIETAQFRQAVISSRPNSLAARLFQTQGIEPRVVGVLQSPCPSGFGANCRVVEGGLDIGSLTGAAGRYVDIGANPLGGGFDNIPDIQFAQLQTPTATDGHQFNTRLDYQAGADRFTFSTYITRRTDEAADQAGRSRPLGDLRNQPVNSSYFLTWNRVLTSRLYNEVRFNVTRFASNQVTASAATNFGIPALEIESLPFDRIRFGASRAETTPAIFAQNQFEFRDYLRQVVATHALSYGVEIRVEQNNSNIVGGARPIYTFQGLFNFANDAPIFEAINANPQTGAPADAQRYLRNRVYSVFAQDDWKVRPNLTLNLGLRWEYFTPLSEKRGLLSNIFYPGPGQLAGASVRPVDELTSPDRNNFGPRFGFAYTPTALSNRVVLRGGYGLFFNRIPSALFGNARGNPPFFARYNICCGTAGSPLAGGQIQYNFGANNSPLSYPANPQLAVPIDPATGAPTGRSVEIWGAFTDSPNSYVHVWSTDMQFQLPGQMVGSAGYQASAGHKLIRIVNQNFLYPNNPSFFATYIPTPDVNSNFNALLLSLTKQYARGLQFAANYRWSKSIDTLSSEGPGAVTNQTWPQDQSTERGPSDFDVRHYFTFSGLYDLPVFRTGNNWASRLIGGWQLSGIYTRHSGFPWTPKTGQSVSTPGGPTLAPTRPIAYFGGAGNDRSDQAFITGSNFSGGGRQYFDISRGGPPGIGRNSFRGPRYDSVDFSLRKETRFGRVPLLGEGPRLELRVNLYNALNQLNLKPLEFFDAGTMVEDPNFGRAGAALSGRVVELQARFVF